MLEKKRRNFQAKSYAQDIVESSEPAAIFTKKSQLGNRISEISIVGHRKIKLVEPESSEESQSKEFPSIIPESCIESREEQSGYHPVMKLEKKAKKKRKISLLDSESGSNQDYNLTENENPNYQSHIEAKQTNLEENRKKKKLKEKRKSTRDLREFCSPIKKKYTGNTQTLEDNLEIGETIRSKKSLANTTSSSSSTDVSVKDLKTLTEVSRKDRKCKIKEKLDKKKSNTLLKMIYDSTNSSESDEETIKIHDSSEKILEKKNRRKHSKSRVINTLLIDDDDNEEEHSNTKHKGNFTLLSNCEKTSDDYRSVNHEKEKKCSKSNRQSFKHPEMIKSGKLSSGTASNCDSPNISDKDVKTEPEVTKKNRKHKEKEKKKVKKNKINTILTLIHDSSSSDSNDETMKINDNSEETLNKRNQSKRSKSGVIKRLSINDGDEESHSSSEEEEDPSSNMKHVANPSGKSRKFDLEAEARDLEEIISTLEEAEQIPRETMRKLHKLRIRLKHTVPPQHQVETTAGSRGPTPKQKEIMEKFGPIKYGKFSPEEDDIIVKNWKSFCKMHSWDPRDVRPFLYMRHQHAGLITKFAERQKFVQFLADRLPWRTLYSVYWRFRNLYQPHLQTRYTEDEDKLIIAHMENSLAIDTKNVRKFSELAKVLNRTRASVWRRYRLLNKKRNPCKRIQWDLHLVKKVIKSLIQLTLSEDVHQLKDLDIPLVVWKKLSRKFNISNKHLKQFWLAKLHIQLFCKEPVYLNDIKIKLIEYFYITGVTEWWEIEWPNIAKHFDGMTTTFLSRTFNRLIHDEKLQGMELSQVLEYLYEDKKPQLQQAPMDKCLPRIVFQDGNIKMLDMNENDRPKLKTVIENSWD